MYFTSEGHLLRFLTAVQQINKIYDGKIDQEYGAALYILTSDRVLWQKTRSYVSHWGLSFEDIFQEVDLSGGYGVLVHLAGNLFNGRTTPCDAVELMRLDGCNFQVALTALRIRRAMLTLEQVKEEEKP